MMKMVIRLLTIVFCIAGSIAAVRWSRENRQLEDQVRQLEAELGWSKSDDPNRVHIVEIEHPNVPPEIAPYLVAVWQFRCHLPKGYSAMSACGTGRVAKQGIYIDGGASTGWSSAKAEPIHALLTLSLVKSGDKLLFYTSSNGTASVSYCRDILPNHVDDSWVVKQLVRHKDGPRSFDQNTILPLLKIYDPASAQEKQVHGKPLTTYEGCIFGWCPKSREQAYRQLENGLTPQGFDPSWIATEASDE